MRVDVLTLFPEAFAGPLDVSIIKRARDGGLLDLHLHDIREHANRPPPHPSTTSPSAVGHGMVMKVDVLDAALQAAQAGAEPPAHVIYLSPQGELLNDALVRELAAYPRLLLVADDTRAWTNASSSIAPTARSPLATTS